MIYGASHFLGMGLGFLSSMILVRVADRPSVGSYLLLLQATLALALILELGLGQAALRFAPVCRGAGGEAYTRLLRRRLLLLEIAVWIVVAPPVYFVWPFLARRLEAPELASAAPFLLTVAMLSSFSRIVDAYLRAFRFYTASAVLTHFLPRALLLGGFVFLLGSHVRDASWGTLIAIFLLAQLVTTLGYAFRLPATTAAETSEPRTALPPPPTGEIFTTTFAMGLRSAAAILMISSDLWVLSWARSHTEVAVYGVVTRIMQVMEALTLIASFIIPQEFAMLWADGKKAELERLARTAATAVAILSLGSLLGIAVLGRPLIRFAFGQGYLSGWGILLVLAVGVFWDAASGGSGYLLQMTGNHVILFLLTLVSALVNLALSLFLAPRLGGYGVAIATSATLVGINIAFVATVRRRLGVKTFVYFRVAEWRRVFGQLLPFGRERRGS
jgi:O-antigen/teichoic acid export membrane protein